MLQQKLLSAPTLIFKVSSSLIIFMLVPHQNLIMLYIMNLNNLNTERNFKC
jgi:hypothetical protein